MTGVVAGPLLQKAVEAMRAGRWEDARSILADLTRSQPNLADGRHLYGVTLKRLGRFPQAEAELLAAIALDRRHAPFQIDLASLQAAAGRIGEAEQSFRAALALDPTSAAAALPLTEILTGTGRAFEAVDISAPFAKIRTAGEAMLAVYAEALNADGRPDEALAIYQRCVVAYPKSAVAEHNVASSLVAVGRNVDAEAAVQRAFAKGLNAPETWLVLGRALQGQDRFDLAKQAFEQAIRLRPAFAMAHAELAQLNWMLTEDLAAASAPVDAIARVFPKEPSLKMVKARLLEYAGDLSGADEVLHEAAKRPDAPSEILVAASRAAVRSDPERALHHAEAALTRGGWQDDAPEMAACEALLALGRTKEAADIVEMLRARRPLDQHVLAYQAIVWRLLGDPRYEKLYDYDALVRPWILDTPDGWPTLEAFLSDLRTSLAKLHTVKAHPLGQSIRGGTQTGRNLLQLEDPAVQGFLQAIDGPIKRHLSALGQGSDPLRSRTLNGYKIAGIWSVRLRPSGGRHVDHVHQKGWLSSACYIDLPPAVGAGGDQGWIKFGEPGVPTSPPLSFQHKVKPEPGMLVLFPSYMWHGTIPFGGAQPRLTVAFDVLPAA